MARPLRELAQRRRGALAGFRTFAATEPARQIVDEGCRDMMQAGEVNVTLRFATRAFNREPGIATIDRLIDGWRWIDGTSVGPHAFVPAFADEPVGLTNQRDAFGSRFVRLRG